jgi:hypothetical protein
VRACTGKLACVSVGVGRVLCCFCLSSRKEKKEKKKKEKKTRAGEVAAVVAACALSFFCHTRARASSSTPTQPWPAMRWSVRSWTVGAHALAPLAAGRRRSGGVLRQEMTRLTASASAPMPPPCLSQHARRRGWAARVRPARDPSQWSSGGWHPRPWEARGSPVNGSLVPPPPKRRTAAPARSPPFLCAPPLNPITSFFLSLSPPPSPPQLPPARGAGAGREGHGRRLRLLRHGRRRRPVHAALAGDDRGAAQRALMEK